jgi:hypothetical protein
MTFLKKIQAQYKLQAEIPEGKIHLLSISSEINEDSYTAGDGKSTGAGLSEKIGKTFNSAKDMCKWLSSHYGLSDDINDYDFDDSTFQTDKQVADHSEAQNGGWMEPTTEEIAEWKKGNLVLYNEHYFINIMTAKHLT